LQPHLLFFQEEAFESSFIVDEGDDYVPVSGTTLPLDDHDVTVKNAGVDHLTTGHPERKALLLLTEEARQLDGVFYVLVREKWNARRHSANKRNARSLGSRCDADSRRAYQFESPPLG
jgi:hypothetical protein